MRVSEYSIESKKISNSCKFCVISDLHGCDPQRAIELLKKIAPDFILAPGDIFERVDGLRAKYNKMNEKGFLLLTEAAKIAPTFYACGNHEIGGTRSWAKGLKFNRYNRAEWSEENAEKLRQSGVVFVNDGYVVSNGIAFGGLASGILNEDGKPSLEWLDRFCAEECPKILLCHHPEYYEKYLKSRNIDVILSGHAHGGQIRLFGRGLYAPGQGILPSRAGGLYDGRLAVGRGLANTAFVPRFFNPREIVIVDVEK